MRRAPVLLVLAAVLAGCAQPQAEPASAGNASIDVAVGERPETTFGNVTTGPAAPPDLNATLDRAPRWVPGEWWRIRFTSPLTGLEEEFVRVVAAVEGDQYLVGMPHEGWYKEVMVVHAPGFGEVRAEDLSWHTHDNEFQPLRFPLTDDATWTTSFSGGPELTATVVTDPAQRTAEIAFSAPNGNTPLRVVYDAKAHEIVRFEHPILTYEVLEHGYDFRGWVTIPRAEDLVFFHGRALGVNAFGAPPPAPSPNPRETVEIAGGYNRMSFFQAVGGGLPGPLGAVPTPASGAYRAYAKGPDGTEFVTEAVPGGPLAFAFFESAGPDGAWELEHVAAGPGVAFIEGIAYHQYDIRLPDAARRSDHAHAVVR